MANLRIVSCRCLNESCSLLSYVPSFFPNGTSSKSKKRKSVTISAPIPCNTAFPSDNPAMSKLSMPNMDTDTRSDTPSKSTGSTASEISDSESNSFDSEPNTPKRQSLCSQGEGVLSEGANESTSETTNDESVQANGQEHQDSVSAADHREEEETISAAAASEETHHASTDRDNEDKPLSDAQDKTAPVPNPRRSSTAKKDKGETDQNTSGCSEDVKVQKIDYENPPGFLSKVLCLWKCWQSLICICVVCNPLYLFSDCCSAESRLRSRCASTVWKGRCDPYICRRRRRNGQLYIEKA